MDERARADLEHDFNRLREGDRSAVEPVFARLLPIVRAFATRLVDASDVDDATQLALEKIFSRASDFEPGRPLLPWVLTLAGWECRTLRTRSRRRKESPDTDLSAHTAPGADPEAAVARAEMLAAAIATFDDLAPRDRDVLRAAFSDEASLPHDATFRKRKERALDRLRGAFLRIYGY